MADEAQRTNQRYVQTLVVLLVGALAVGVLALSADRVHRNSEQDALRQRAEEASTALRAVLPVFQVPLSSSIAVAEETGGDPSSFNRVISGFVGPGSLTQTASLWSVDDEGAVRLAVVGTDSQLSQLPAEEREQLLRDAPAGGLGIIDLTDRSVRSLGFTVASDRDGVRLVTYMEATLADDPTALDITGDAFDDLDYAVYLGGEVAPRRLLLATTRALPLEGEPEQIAVPWGNTELQLVFTPKGRLTGTLLARLPWMIALVGGLLVLAFTWLTRRLGTALDRSATLAVENERLFIEQRTVAQTLQRDLLPPTLPEHPAVELARLYQSGVADIEIGGDWYDAVRVDDHRLLLTVGDVSGQGLAAASIMVGLRMSIRAYAMEGAGPASILGKLNRLLDVREDRHFATVLCATFDLRTRELVIASAGHPPPVVVREATALLPVAVGFPIGVRPTEQYAEITTVLAAGDLFVAYTDGLFERRGETVDDGLARVVRTVEQLRHEPAEQLVQQLAGILHAAEAPDDTAVLAMRVREPVTEVPDEPERVVGGVTTSPS